MSTPVSVNNRGLSVGIQQSVQRQTPQTDFASMVKKGATIALDTTLGAVNVAAPFIPGGTAVSAAVTGMRNVASGLTTANGATTAQGANAGSLGGGTVVGSGSGVGGNVGSGGGAFDAVNAQAAGGDKQAQMFVATKELQEMNQSFNMQYLQLQEDMQNENRKFTMLSNVMKTKHDTAKNAINNVR
jgi:hypothetical protein